MSVTFYKAVAVFIRAALDLRRGLSGNIYMWSGISQFALDFSIPPIAANRDRPRRTLWVLSSGI